MKTRCFNNTNIPLEIGPSCLISDSPQYKDRQIECKSEKCNLASILLVTLLLFLMFLIRIIKVNIFLIGLLLLEIIYNCEVTREKSVRKIRSACKHLNNKLKGLEPLRGKTA